MTRLNGKDRYGHLQKDTDSLMDSVDYNGRIRTSNEDKNATSDNLVLLPAGGKWKIASEEQ